MTVINCSLLFLLTDTHILLAHKKRGFGMGLLNGVGGKIEQSETAEQAAVRECQEEVGVTPRQLHHVATHRFLFPDPQADMHVTVFTSTQWDGDPIETDEMAPTWIARDTIPYDRMWADDIYWLPAVLAGQHVQTTAHFNAEQQLQDITVTPEVQTS